MSLYRYQDQPAPNPYGPKRPAPRPGQVMDPEELTEGLAVTMHHWDGETTPATVEETVPARAQRARFRIVTTGSPEGFVTELSLVDYCVVPAEHNGWWAQENYLAKAEQ